MCEATRHPTIIRERASLMKHPSATPAQAGTTVRSVTQSWFGAAAATLRCTKSGCRAAAGSALVVRTRLPRRTPSMPAARISRAT